MIQLVKEGVLVAPFKFWHLDHDTKNNLCNGCGPQGNIFHRLLSAGIPDNFLGLSIKEACNIHDYCRIVDMDQKEGDNLFLDNMSSLIDNYGGPLEGVRHWMAFHYWLAVRCWKKREK